MVLTSAKSFSSREEKDTSCACTRLSVIEVYKADYTNTSITDFSINPILSQTLSLPRLPVIGGSIVHAVLDIDNVRLLSNVPGAAGVIDAVNQMGGVPMFGTNLPIWAVVLTEFICAYALELLGGNPCSFRLARRVSDPKKTHPVLFETTIICFLSSL